MAIDFPANPTTNDTFTVGSITYKWDGAKWIGLGVTPTDRLIEGNNKLEIDASNNLIWTGNNFGIGTDNPSGQVQIDTTSGARALTVNAPTLGTYIAFETGNTVFADIGSEAGLVGSGSNTDMLTLNARGSRSLSFRTNSNERLRITSTGKLEAYKGTSTTGKTSGSEAFTVGNGAGNHRFAVYPDGTTVIGGTGDIANNNIILQNDGMITAAGAITAAGNITAGNATSDAVIKVYGGGGDNVFEAHQEGTGAQLSITGGGNVDTPGYILSGVDPYNGGGTGVSIQPAGYIRTGRTDGTDSVFQAFHANQGTSTTINLTAAGGATFTGSVKGGYFYTGDLANGPYTYLTGAGTLDLAPNSNTTGLTIQRPLGTIGVNLKANGSGTFATGALNIGTTGSVTISHPTTSASIKMEGDISGNYTGWKERNVASGSMSQASIDSKTPTINDFTYPNSSNGMLIWSTSKIGFAAGSESPQWGSGVQMLYDGGGLMLGGIRAFDRTSSSSTSTTWSVRLKSNGQGQFKGNVEVGPSGAPATTITSGGSITSAGDLTINTDALFVDASAKKVGIGESSPAVGLDVKKATAGTIGRFYDIGSNGDALHNGGPIVGLSRISDGTVALDGLLFQVGIDTSSTSSYNIDETVFCVSNTGVGIGRSSSLELLDVKGGNDESIKFSASSYGGGHLRITGADETISGTGGPYGHTIRFKTKTNNNNNGHGSERDALIFFHDGWGSSHLASMPSTKLGINDTSPSKALCIKYDDDTLYGETAYGPNAGVIKIFNESTTAGCTAGEIMFGARNSGSAYAMISGISPGSQECELAFRISDSAILAEAMRIKKNGSVLINTTYVHEASAKLIVLGESSTTNNLINSITVNSKTTGTAAAGVGTGMTFLGSMTGQDNVELGRIGFHNTNVSGAYGDFVVQTRPNGPSVERLRITSDGQIHYKPAGSTTSANMSMDRDGDYIRFNSKKDGSGDAGYIFRDQHGGALGERLRINSDGIDVSGLIATNGSAAGDDGTIWCNYGGSTATRNGGVVGSYTPFAGMVAPNGAGARYLHVKFNITGGAMWMIDIKGYDYNGSWTSQVNGSSYTYDKVHHSISGGYNYNYNALYNGKSIAYRGVNPGWYLHSNLVCCYIDTTATGGSNRWGFYKFEGGHDGIIGASQQKAISVVAYTYSTGTGSAF